MAPSPDLDVWNQHEVPVTHSAELQNLERHAEYAIAVAARTATVRYILFLRLFCKSLILCP